MRGVSKRSCLRLEVAALPRSLRKASGFPSAPRELAAMPRRRSLLVINLDAGKPEAFRKECGKAAE